MRPADSLLALIVAALVAAAMILSPLQTHAMAMKMDMPSGMTGAMHDGCQDCPQDGGDTGLKAVTCGMFCAVPVLAVVPGELPADNAPIRPLLTPAYQPLPYGWSAAPDPHPPPTAHSI